MSQTNISLAVLAAGMGSRYGGLKQMDGIGPGGATLLEYSVFDALQSGFNKFYFIIRQSIAKDFEQIVLQKLPRNLNYELVFQELDYLPGGLTPPPERTKPWGTGHALWCASNQIKESFAILNADDFYGRSGFEQIARFFKHATSANEFCMVGYPLNKTMSKSGSVARGICVEDSEGFLKTVDEKTDVQFDASGNIICDLDSEQKLLSGNELVSMNFWGFTPQIFPLCDILFNEFLEREGKSLKSEFYIPKMVNELIQRNMCIIKVYPSSNDWIGVTYQQDKPLASSAIEILVRQGLYPLNLWNS
jgi:UTP-glucose-1-phosphate uridylyltransferase